MEWNYNNNNTMGKIAIITDSASDITPEMAAEYGITVLPMYISFGGKTYKEGQDLNSQQVYRALDQGHKIHTAGPSIGDFMKAYAQAFKQDDVEKIYSINLSGKLSGTINSAMAAKKNFPPGKIEIIDSKNATISMGLMVIEIARLAQRDPSRQKLEQAIALLVEKNSFFAAIENFKYVLRSGRTPFLGSLLAKALIFKPVVSVNQHGKIYLKRMLKNKNSAIRELYKQTAQAMTSDFHWNIGIFYGLDRGPAEELKKMFAQNKDLPVKTIMLSQITAVISAHTGPGIWGAAFGPSLDL